MSSNITSQPSTADPVVTNAPSAGGATVVSGEPKGSLNSPPDAARTLPNRTPRNYFHALLRNLGWPASVDALGTQTLGITSCQHGEGVTTVVVQTALAAVESSDHRVLLIDANIGQPRLHELFSLSLSPGLAELSSGKATGEEVVRATAIPQLYVVTAGVSASGRPAGSQRIAESLHSEAFNFDLLLFDLPPACQVGAAAQLYPLLDGVLLVVEHEGVRRQVAQRTAAELARAGGELLGVVLNKRKQHIPNWLYRRL